MLRQAVRFSKEEVAAEQVCFVCAYLCVFLYMRVLIYACAYVCVCLYMCVPLQH